VPTDRSEATARRFVAALNGGAAADVESGLRIFKGRSHIPGSIAARKPLLYAIGTLAAYCPGCGFRGSEPEGWRLRQAEGAMFELERPPLV
jgi:hypothetical protein